MRPPLIITLFFGLVSCAWASPIYKGTDVAGRTVYSNVSPQSGAVIAELPRLGRWKPVVDAVADATCEKHGGESCGLSADVDGSIICIDGYRDAVSRFAERCQLAKLELLAAPQRASDSPTSLRASVRNNSATQAHQVLVSFIVNKFDPPLLFTGPDKIEPYSIADYQVSTTLEETPIYRRMTGADVALECGNCR